MSRNDFIKELRNNLSVLPFYQIEEIINDYLNYFDKEILNGKSEESIIMELGDPELIAQSFYEELVDQKDLKKPIILVKKNISLFIGVIVFDILIGFILIVALYALAFALFSIGFLNFFLITSLILEDNQLTLLETLASFIINVGLSLLSISFGYLLFTTLKKGLKHHFQWLSKLIKGGYYEVS